VDDLKGKKTGEDTRDYAFQSYFYIQNLANSTNSSNDPLVKRALLMLRRFPNNRALIDKYVKYVEKHLKAKQKVKELFPNPFEPNPTNAAVDGELKLGNVRHSGASFGLNLDELNEHVLIAGRAGAGKTTLIYIILIQLLKLGVPFWAFDFKQDYRHLARTGKVLVFNWDSFRFNPLRPPLNVNPQVWMQAFTNVFCQVYWLLSGSKGIILEHVKNLYQDYGVFSGSDVFPSMFDLLESLKQHRLERKYGREAGFLESSQNRVNECLLSLGVMLGCDKGFSTEELLGKNVVFELEGLLAENQAFLLNILLRYVFQYRISNNQRSGLKHVFLFDEAKAVYNREREFSKELGVSEIAQFTSTIREFGEGLVVADQMPTQLADSIKANVYTVICMSQSGGPNIAEMSKAMGLTKEQADACRVLQSDKASQVFEAVVKLNGKWLTPFVTHVIPFKVEKDVTNADVQNFMSPMLAELNQRLIPRAEYGMILDARKKEELLREADKRKERAEEKEKVEGNILIQLLTNIRDHPFIDQKTRIQTLGLQSSSSTTDKYFKELIANGFVTVHRIGLGRGQSTKVLYEITGKGADFARMNKVSIPGKGDFKHKFWQHTIKKFFESLGYNAEIEKRYGFKNVDVGLEMNGNKTAVEVELSPEHLLENVQKDSEAGSELIIVAVPNQRSINAYWKKIKAYNKDLLKKVEFRVLTDFLP
jgi:hypothetical protein